MTATPSLPVRLPHLRLDLRHARYPAIVILRLHARDQVPRGVDMRHDMHGPAALPRLVRGAARVGGERIEAAADAGIGAEQRDRAELLFGLLDDVQDILFLADIAFEGSPIDR